MKRTVRLTIEVEYDSETGSPDELAEAFDILLDTSLSTSGIVDDFHAKRVGSVQVEPDENWSPGCYAG